MLTTTPLLYRWLALAALMVASAGFGAMEMHSHDSKAHAIELARIQAEGLKQIAHTQTVIANQKEVTNVIASDYNTRLASLRKFYYADKLRTNPSSGNMPAIPETPGRVNEATADKIPDTGAVIPSASATLQNPADINLMPLCAETTLQLLSLQSWINKQASIK